jgi:O-antigen ligase
MIYLFLLLSAGLLLGQLGGIMLAPGVAVYVHDIVVGVMIVWGIVRAIRTKRFVVPILTRSIVAFAAVGVCSLLVSLVYLQSWQVVQGSLYLWRWIAYACVYVCIVQEKQGSMMLLRGLYVSGSIFSVLGLVQYVLYPNLRNLWYLGWDPHYFRLFSTFLDPNFAGLFILLTILLGIVLSWPKRWYWVLQCINLVALYLTYSRSSYLAFVVAIIVWIIFSKQWRWSIVLCAAIAAILFIPTPGGETLRLLRVDSTLSRIANWYEAVQLIQRSPVLGHGFNTLRFVQPGNSVLVPNTPLSRAAAGVDNSVLFLLTTTGFIGIVVYLLLLYRMQGISRASHIAILTAILVHSQFINSLFYPWIMLWIWIYAGAAELKNRKKDAHLR